jgi:hypothetical protein
MIAIDQTLISEEILEKRFVCNLNACKGECCVAGDSGAPLEQSETTILDDIFEIVKPYMAPDGIKAVEQNGKYIIDFDGDIVTPLVENKHCAYVIFEDNMAKCAIEKAYLEGKINFKKPISCHLYPIRISKYKDFEAVNYDKWDICNAACDFGTKLDIKVYQFLKEPLIRKFGKTWYEQLEIIAEEYEKKNK